MGVFWDIEEKPEEIVMHSNLNVFPFLMAVMLIGFFIVFVAGSGFGLGVIGTAIFCLLALYAVLFILQWEPYTVLTKAKAKGYIRKDPLKLISDNYRGEENITQMMKFEGLFYFTATITIKKRKTV
jgi:hypothetical protein